MLNEIEQKGLPSFRFADKKIADVIVAAIPWIFAFAGLLLLVYLIYGGFHLMTSGGDPKGIAEGKAKVTNAILGFVIVFIAFWLVQIIARVLGLTTVVTIFG